MKPELIDLKARIAALETTRVVTGGDRFGLGVEAVDADLAGGLSCAALHEIHAEAQADGPSALAFALGLAIRAGPGRPMVWALQDRLSQEWGQPHGPGLHELGLSPQRLVLVRARDPADLLAATEDALRNPAVGVALISLWGEPRALDLTAMRRLSLAAAEGRTTGLMVRVGATVAPGAAETRWRVRSVPSRALEADAPGAPTFSVSLLRHRRGVRPRDWIMEWSREDGRFLRPAPLSGGVVPLPAGRPAGAVADLRRAG